MFLEPNMIKLSIVLAALSLVWSENDFIHCDTPYCCSDGRTANTNIYCDGGKSCENTTTLLAYNYSTSQQCEIFCYGSYSCHNIHDVLLAESILHCNGYDSCSHSTIQNGHTIFCMGQHSCANSIIKKHTYHSTTYPEGWDIYCYGDTSCAQTIISGTKTIHGYGNYSLYGSTIMSNGTDILINLIGNKAGYGLSVYCDINQRCIVNCSDNACNSTYFDCNDTQSNCIVICDPKVQPCPNRSRHDLNSSSTTLILVTVDYINMEKNSVDCNWLGQSQQHMHQ